MPNQTPETETAGQTPVFRRSNTTTVTYGGYVGTLIVTDDLAPRVGVSPHVNGKGGTPIPTQPMDAGQIGALITILTELRDELLYPNGKDAERADGEGEPPTVNELLASQCMVRGCTLKPGHGSAHFKPGVGYLRDGLPTAAEQRAAGSPTADCPPHCQKNHDHALARSRDPEDTPMKPCGRTGCVLAHGHMGGHEGLI